MTYNEFNSLPPDEQEKFINNGGAISRDDASCPSKVVPPSHTDNPPHNGTSSLENNLRQNISPHEGSFSSPHNVSDGCADGSQSCEKSVTPSPSIDEFGQLVGTNLLPDGRASVDGEVKESLNSRSASLSSPEDAIYTEGFDIQDPVELLYLLDDDIREGRVTLHDWQIQFMLDFASGGQSDRNPFQAIVRACNGSGKDKYIIAACAVWLCMRYKKARCVITSSSGVQLDNQTCAYITLLANESNTKWGKVWKCNYRYYECLATQSPMICYATDEAGKAEGFHPLAFGCKMAIFMSEDKTIPDDINTAINKCTGYTHRVHASTPGIPVGHFFNLDSTAIPRSSIKSVNSVNPEDYIRYHVRARDCSHISESYVKQMERDLPGGKFGAAYKSQVEAEFGTTDEMVVIPYQYVWKAVNSESVEWIPEPYNKAGLDLSDGGDETVLIVRNGNKVLKVIPFKFDNTEDTIAFLNEQFKENNLVHKDALIFADCIGIGKPILDRMKRQGWSNIRYVDSRQASIRPKTYRNKNAENWFNLGNLLKQSELILIRDDKLIRQLATRYYKTDGAIHQLLSKIEQKSRGYPSPDRADALVYAFSDYKSTFVSSFDDEDKKPTIEGVEEDSKEESAFSLKSWSKGTDDYNARYNVNNGQKDWSSVEDEIEQYNQRIITNKE